MEGKAIRYGLTAIKGIGKPVQEVIVAEREANGPFTSIRDLADRLSGKEINKRTVENFIKSGAFDGFGGNRHQYMLCYAQILDQVNQEKKNSLTGQMSLFDWLGDAAEETVNIPLPDVAEYDKEELLAFEKEVLGIYVSGHPLQEYEELWRKTITTVSTKFMPDEESGVPLIEDGSTQVIGGLISEKTIKYTKTNQVMAFLTIEDLVGSVEVVVFPRTYERYNKYMEKDAKVFVSGRVSAEDDKPSKLICEQVVPFADSRRELWIQFADRAEYDHEVAGLYDVLRSSDGQDQVVLYLKAEKAVKRLPASRTVQIDADLTERLKGMYGDENIRIVEKSPALGKKRG